MNDDRFVRELRSFLEERAADPAPSLSARLAGVTAANPPSRWRMPLAAAGAWAAVLAIAVIGLPAVLDRATPRAGSTTVLAPVGTFPEPGAGFDTPEAPWGHLAVAAIALAAALLGVALARRRVIRLAFVAAIALAALGVAGLATHDPVSWPDQTWAIGEGRHDTVVEDDGTNQWNRAWLAIDPDELFTVAFDVVNAGPLDLTVVGIEEPFSPNAYTIVGLGLAPTGGAAVLDQVAPFRPVVLPPGARQRVVVAGRGGPCAEPQLGPPSDRGGVGLPSFMLVYSVLGWERVERVAIQDEVLVGVRIGCSGPDP